MDKAPPRFRVWSRVKAVREGPQCLYKQRYGTVMEVHDGGIYTVLLDDFAGTYYQEDQLEEAEPQRSARPPVEPIEVEWMRKSGAAR